MLLCCRGLAFASLAVLAMCGPTFAVPPVAGPDGCGHGRVLDRGSPGLRSQGNVHMAVNDTLRALVVFARFPDGDDGAACDPLGWPNGTVVPAWADSLLEDSEPPVKVGTLTHFLSSMSQGKHVVLGTYYPEVVLLDSTIVHYDTTYPSGSDADAILHANLAVTLEVAAQWDTLLTEFDRNDDGFLDHLHIVYRSTKSTAGSQYNLMETFNAVSWHAPYYSADTTLVFSNGDSLKIDDETGSCQRPINAGGFRRTRRATFDTFKHEYMHDVVESYGLPLNLSGVGHLKSMGPYGVMDGTYIGDGQFIDGFTLAELGWVAPIEIDSTSGGGDTTIVLTAAPDPQGYAIVRTQDPNQYFVLELRNKALPYALGQGIPGCLNPAGFTGLLVTHICRDGRNGWGFNGEPPLFDPEVATGMFADDGAPDPIAGADTIQAAQDSWWTATTNDLYKPFNVDAFAPWSNPSSNLYAPNGGLYSSQQTVHSGITLSDVVWLGAGFNAIQVRVRFEGSQPPAGADTIRVSTTWQGLVQLTGDLVVADGATVTAAQTAKVVARALHDRHATGQDPLRTEITALGAFLVNGTPTTLPLITSSRDDAFIHYNGPGEDLPAAPGDWRGLRVLGHAALSRADLRYAITGVSAVSADSARVDDCILSGFADTGILFTNTAGLARHNVIVGADSVSQRGIALVADAAPCYATVLGNTVYAARTGVSFTGLAGAATVPTGVTAIDSNLVAQLALPWEWQGIAVDGASRRDGLVVRSNDVGPASDVGLLLRRCRSVVVSDCNRIEGARVGIFADASERSCGVTGNLVLNSTQYGVRIRGTGPSGQIIAPVFGDVTSATFPGRNNIHGSGLQDVVATTGVAGTVLAQNNWWGTATPLPSQFQGPIHYTPWGTVAFTCDTSAAAPQSEFEVVFPEPRDEARQLSVGAPWPNPFGGDEVHWNLRAPAEGDVAASLYDVRGRRVRGLTVSGDAAGGLTLRWDGKNEWGDPVGAGVYFLRVESSGRTETRKVIRTR